MTASEGSFVGFAKQTAKGTPNTTDGEYSYFLFNEGTVGPQNNNLPLDQEVGGGAMLRGVVRVGVSSVGAFSFIPRPTILGNYLLGALGEAAAPAQQGSGAAYLHGFTLPTNQFDAPYWTVRSTPGGLWGEQFQDARVANLAFTWRAADYLRGQVAFIGGLPTPNVATGAWNAAAAVDGGPQFLAPLFSIELPTSTAVKCISGAFTAGMQIPMDEQWITGSYSPDDFDINQRAFALTMVVKTTDKVLYNKMNYDKDDGAAWLAEIFREADLKLQFLSDVEADTAYPYSLEVKANAQTGANANVLWTATPISMRAGRQLTMAVTGTFIADPLAGDPITVELINAQTTQY
jgi:hypothetical protein